MNKKAVEMNINTIIIVILAVLVLVILALYFTGGMTALWEKITGVSGAYNEADITTARQLCGTYCAAGNGAEYCLHEFSIRKENTDPEKNFCYGSVIKGGALPECKEESWVKDSCAEYQPTGP